MNIENIKEWLVSLPIWVWVVVISIAVIVTVIFIMNKKFKLFVFRLVIHAEETIVGEKKGEERYNMVVERIYAFLPKFLQILFPQSYINNIITRAVEKMKAELQKKDQEDN